MAIRIDLSKNETGNLIFSCKKGLIKRIATIGFLGLGFLKQGLLKANYLDSQFSVILDSEIL